MQYMKFLVSHPSRFQLCCLNFDMVVVICEIHEILLRMALVSTAINAILVGISVT